MQPSARLRSIVAIALGLLVLGGGAALAATGGQPSTSDVTCVSPSIDASVDPSVKAGATPHADPSDTAEPSGTPDPAETPDPSETPEPCESPEPSESPDRSESPDPSDSVEPTESDTPERAGQPPADRTAECYAAAGIAPNAAVPTDAPTTGLANAIQHVLGNCIKNPQAPGLINALEHLYANEQRKAVHEADKAARTAEHEAGHQDHGTTHGNGGEHGNSGEHGHTGEHGEGESHGSGEHGNSGHGNGD